MRAALVPRQWRRLAPQPPLPLTISLRKKLRLPRIPSKRLVLRLLVIIVLIAFVPPVFFHFRLRRFHQMRMRKCDWLGSPPLVCAHGGDSSQAAPNTMDAYRIAILSRVDCIEIDVSRSIDGTLFALHDRDLQRMTANSTAKVGFMSTEEINKLQADVKLGLRSSEKILTIHEALTFVSGSVRQVVLDVKVGPPSFEKDLAKDVLSVVQRSDCKNCLIWAKSDAVVHDIMNLKEDAKAGYIVMKDPVTGATSNLLRMKNAAVVGVYHPLVNKKLVQILHGSRRKVYAWTVDDADSMKRLLFEHVDAMVTGHPSLLQKVYAWTVDDADSMKRLLFEHVDAMVTGHPSLLQKVMQELETQCLAEGFSLP